MNTPIPFSHGDSMLGPEEELALPSAQELVSQLPGDPFKQLSPPARLL